jgi:hypothetical protein
MMTTMSVMRELTFYELLDVSPRASTQELREALTAELYLVDEARLRDAPAGVQRVARDRRLRLVAAQAVLLNPVARDGYDRSIGLPAPAARAQVRCIHTRTDGLPTASDCQRCSPQPALTAGLIRARYSSSCPACGAEIERGAAIGPIDAPGGGRAWVCASCYQAEQAYLPG